MKIITVSDAEHATILAALRVFQQAPNHIWNSVRDIRTNCGTLQPMKREDLDGLCEKVNTAPEENKNARFYFGESVSDLARSFATAEFVPDDSMEFHRLVIAWAEEFEKKHAGRVWDGEWIEEIEAHFHQSYAAWQAYAPASHQNSLQAKM